MATQRRFMNEPGSIVTWRPVMNEPGSVINSETR